MEPLMWKAQNPAQPAFKHLNLGILLGIHLLHISILFSMLLEFVIVKGFQMYSHK